MLLYLLISCVFVVSGEEISYNVISYATTGEPCMTDCIQGKCRINWTTEKPCNPGNVPAPIYYTSSHYEGHQFCRSKCDKFGYNYNWCIIDDRRRWDYCNPSKDIKYSSLQMSRSGECRSECGKRGSLYNWCRLYTGEWDFCDQKKYEYVQAHTHKGEKCRSFCGTHREGGTKCYAAEPYAESCAPPLIDQTLLQTYYSQIQAKFNLNNINTCAVRIGSRLKRFIDPAPRNYLLTLVDAVENQISPLFNTVDVNEVGNSVYRYTVLRLNTVCEPTLPLIIRARITMNTLQPPGSRAVTNAISAAARTNVRNMGMNTGRADENNDEVGHLIAYQNGGSNQPYNFVPQARNVNRGYSNSEVSVGSVWQLMENNINSWVRRYRGSVEQTVFVHYNLPSTRPTGFSVSIDNYLPDGSRGHSTTFYISNDPTCLRDNADMSISF